MAKIKKKTKNQRRWIMLLTLLLVIFISIVIYFFDVRFGIDKALIEGILGGLVVALFVAISDLYVEGGIKE